MADLARSVSKSQRDRPIAGSAFSHLIEDCVGDSADEFKRGKQVHAVDGPSKTTFIGV
jgi:hypothetical protein